TSTLVWPDLTWATVPAGRLACPATRRGQSPPSPGPLPASFGLCRRDPARCREWRAFLAQRPAAEQDAAHDGADGEDAGDPPERGVVAVRQRQPGQGPVADEPGR